MDYGWRIVGTVFVAQLFMVGFITYSYPLLVVPIEAEFNSGMEMISYGLIFSSVVGIILPLFIGPLVDRWSARFLMMIGTGFLALGLAALSFAPQSVLAPLSVSSLIFNVGLRYVAQPRR